VSGGSGGVEVGGELKNLPRRRGDAEKSFCRRFARMIADKKKLTTKDTKEHEAKS
jgi:hypothetical protein